MDNETVLVPAVALDKLAGAFPDTEGSNFRRWPDRPTGTAAQSERGQGVTFADTDARVLPEIVVYQDINFGGASWRTNLNYLYVGSWWNDKISAIIVVRGTWRFYQHRDYKGAYWDLRGPAYYPWVEDANIPNDIISSFRVIAL
ncbi:MAG: beta/gamma crystallin-related protein [Pseudonocardiaceae bacterium]